MSIFRKTKKEPHYAHLLEPNYKWLVEEESPQILKHALHWYGTLELKGDANNMVIIEWAKEVGGWIGSWYDQDSIPWCGLFMAMVAKRAGFPFTQKALSALEWVEWGVVQDVAMLGDVLVFKRKGGGHVGLYVGEDDTCYHVLGGNQSDKVCITRITKKRIYAIRRCDWKYKQPKKVRSIILASHGTISKNEA
jgi:uncharacterized protein (TIGR02594 family)